MVLKIRDAQPEEHERLQSVAIAAYGEFESFLGPDFMNRFSADVLRLMNDPNTEVIVAELDGSPAGTITFYPDGRNYDEAVPADWACLRTLAVLPSARGRGVGRALMDACLARARMLGRTRVLLHTLSFMTAAIALHERLGFRRAPELDVRHAPEVIFIAYLLDLQGVR